MGGLALPDLLRASSASARAKKEKSIIMIYLQSGPPHQDMYDLKMDAPREIRGEFQPIRTKVPGIHISEMLPKIAKQMHPAKPIRSVVGARDEHSNHICFTGLPTRSKKTSRRLANVWFSNLKNAGFTKSGNTSFCWFRKQNEASPL